MNDELGIVDEIFGVFLGIAIADVLMDPNYALSTRIYALFYLLVFLNVFLSIIKKRKSIKFIISSITILSILTYLGFGFFSHQNPNLDETVIYRISFSLPVGGIIWAIFRVKTHIPLNRFRKITKKRKSNSVLTRSGKEFYYCLSTSDVYHSSKCPILSGRDINKLIRFPSRKIAEVIGKVPCHHCKSI